MRKKRPITTPHARRASMTPERFDDLQLRDFLCDGTNIYGEIPLTPDETVLLREFEKSGKDFQKWQNKYGERR